MAANSLLSVFMDLFLFCCFVFWNPHFIIYSTFNKNIVIRTELCPLKLIFWSLIPVWHYLETGRLEVMQVKQDHKGGVLIWWGGQPYRKRQRFSLFLPPCSSCLPQGAMRGRKAGGGHSEKAGACRPGRGLSPEPDCAGPLTAGLQPPEI